MVLFFEDLNRNFASKSNFTKKSGIVFYTHPKPKGYVLRDEGIKMKKNRKMLVLTILSIAILAFSLTTTVKAGKPQDIIDEEYGQRIFGWDYSEIDGSEASFYRIGVYWTPEEWKVFPTPIDAQLFIDGNEILLFRLASGRGINYPLPKDGTKGPVMWWYQTFEPGYFESGGYPLEVRLSSRGEVQYVLLGWLQVN